VEQTPYALLLLLGWADAQAAPVPYLMLQNCSLVCWLLLWNLKFGTIVQEQQVHGQDLAEM
jgi:hypothetical protein